MAYLSLEMLLSGWEFGSSLAGQLTSLLPLDFGRSWLGNTVIQDSDIPAQVITHHRHKLKPQCPWASFFSSSYHDNSKRSDAFISFKASLILCIREPTETDLNQRGFWGNGT